MLRAIRKWMALRSYRRKLAPKLVERYGRSRHYSVAQVRVTAEQLGLNMDFLCYAYAGFCEREAFDEHHAALGEVCDFVTMREEVSAALHDVGVLDASSHHASAIYGHGHGHHGAGDPHDHGGVGGGHH